MGRIARQDFDGAWHHVMNRGTNHERVFFNGGDGNLFVGLLAEGHERFGVELHAFCLMPNHFHLLVHCPIGGLPDFMHWLTSSYVHHLNHRLDRDGPVFRGRYRSIVVDSERYIAQAGRYIHRNPLDIQPPIGLDEYRWSSYRYYVGADEAPPWLQTAYLLQSVSDYRQYVESDFAARQPDPKRLVPVIDFVLDQRSDVTGAAVRGIRRALAITAAHSLNDHQRQLALAELGLTNSVAVRQATHRAKTAIATQPELRLLLDHILELAA